MFNVLLRKSSSRSNRPAGSLRSNRSVLILAPRSKEAVRSVRARLHRDLQPRPPAGERHWQRGYRVEHAAHCRANGARVQRTEKSAWGILWEDRYQATAIEADQHLHRCLVYIGLNMVQAGAVNHPFQMGAPSDLSRDLASQRERRTPISGAGYEDLTGSEPAKELVGSAM